MNQILAKTKKRFADRGLDGDLILKRSALLLLICGGSFVAGWLIGLMYVMGLPTLAIVVGVVTLSALMVFFVMTIWRTGKDTQDNLPYTHMFTVLMLSSLCSILLKILSGLAMGDSVSSGEISNEVMGSVIMFLIIAAVFRWKTKIPFNIRVTLR